MLVFQSAFPLLTRYASSFRNLKLDELILIRVRKYGTIRTQIYRIPLLLDLIPKHRRLEQVVSRMNLLSTKLWHRNLDDGLTQITSYGIATSELVNLGLVNSETVGTECSLIIERLSNGIGEEQVTNLFSVLLHFKLEISFNQGKSKLSPTKWRNRTLAFIFSIREVRCSNLDGVSDHTAWDSFF
jgi:hypothetical protein